MPLWAGKRYLAKSLPIGSISVPGLSAGRHGYQALINIGGRDLRTDPVTGQAAVVVAAATGEQAEIVGEGKQAGPFRIWLVGVEDLHPRQAHGGQPGDLGVRDVPVPARSGV